MIDPILQAAYCATYGDSCDDPDFIQDTLLITDNIKNELNNLEGVNILTMSTGNNLVNKTMITLQLDVEDVGYYEVFKYQLSGNSNHLYKAEVVYMDTGTYLIIYTLNSESADLNSNGRLQQWLERLPSMIKSTWQTTKTFIVDVKDIHITLSEAYDSLKTEIDHVTDVIDNGTENYSEEEQAKNILGDAVEEIAVRSLSDIFRNMSDQIVSIDNASAVITKLTTTDITVNFENTKFDDVQDNILVVLKTLDISSPETVKTQITNELNVLTDIPQDVKDSYANSIFAIVDNFPFSSIDSIVNTTISLGETFVKDNIHDYSELYTKSNGELLSASNSLLESTSVTAAKKLIDNLTNPGNLKNLVAGLGSGVVDDVMGQLPIGDFKSIISDVKSLSTYLDFNTSDTGGMFEEYSQKIINMGLDSFGINGVMDTIKSNIDLIGTILNKFDTGINDITTTFTNLTSVGPLLEKQLGKVSEYYTGVTGPFANQFKNSVNQITDVVDDVTGAPAHVKPLFTTQFNNIQSDATDAAKALSAATGMDATINCFC